jgi:hypothetical protein
MQSDSDLPEIVGTLDSSRRRSDLLNGWQQEPEQYTDNSDDY